MILESGLHGKKLNRFFDSRDDDFFHLTELDFYYPPLPKVYSGKSFRIDGYTVKPDKLYCSCNPSRIDIPGYNELCSHLAKIILANFQHQLFPFQKFLLKIIQQEKSFNSGIIDVNNNYYAILWQNRARMITIFEISNPEKSYGYIYKQDTWLYNIAPSHRKQLAQLLFNLTNS